MFNHGCNPWPLLHEREHLTRDSQEGCKSRLKTIHQRDPHEGYKLKAQDDPPTNERMNERTNERTNEHQCRPHNDPTTAGSCYSTSLTLVIGQNLDGGLPSALGTATPSKNLDRSPERILPLANPAARMRRSKSPVCSEYSGFIFTHSASFRLPTPI